MGLSNWTLTRILIINNDFQYRMRSIGKSGYRFSKIEIRISQSNAKSENGFHLREIRTQGGFQLRNPNLDFLDFPFCRSIGKSEKEFAKLFSWTVVFFLLSMRGHARPLFLRTVFQILFRISQSNGKNENPKTDISAWSHCWNPFSDFAFDCKSETRIIKSKSRFPNRTHP